MRLTVDERVQDGHGTVGDTGVWVDLLEDWKRRVSIRDLKNKGRDPMKLGSKTRTGDEVRWMRRVEHVPL